MDERQARARINGRLPLEQGVAFENAIWDIAKRRRADDKKDGIVLDWQQSAADALVTLAQGGTAATDGGGVARRTGDARSCTSATTRRRCSKAPARSAPRPPSASPATPAALAHPAARRRPRALARGPRRLLRRSSARCSSAPAALPVPRLHRHPRARSAPRDPRRPGRQDRARQPHPALPPPPQCLHDYGIRMSGTSRPTRLQRRRRPPHHRQPTTRPTLLKSKNRAGSATRVIAAPAATSTVGHNVAV